VNEKFLMPSRRGGSSKKRRATSIAIEKLAMCAYTRTTSTRSCRYIKQ
jgi:hypothetical protein